MVPQRIQTILRRRRRFLTQVLPFRFRHLGRRISRPIILLPRSSQLLKTNRRRKIRPGIRSHNPNARKRGEEIDTGNEHVPTSASNASPLRLHCRIRSCSRTATPQVQRQLSHTPPKPVCIHQRLETDSPSCGRATTGYVRRELCATIRFL